MSHKTLLLIDVPKTGPSRRDKIKAFKEQHGIWTHNAGFRKRSEHLWSAMLLNDAIREFGDHEKPNQNPVDIIAGYCRLLEESGLLVTGKTELEAIRTLCQRNNIQCDL